MLFSEENLKEPPLSYSQWQLSNRYKMHECEGDYAHSAGSTFLLLFRRILTRLASLTLLFIFFWIISRYRDNEKVKYIFRWLWGYDLHWVIIFYQGWKYWLSNQSCFVSNVKCSVLTSPISSQGRFSSVWWYTKPHFSWHRFDLSLPS